jgi:SAM-dependent methyltransferase
VSKTQVLSPFLDAIGTQSSILEVGCSYGGQLAFLHHHGFDDLTGIDISKDAVLQAGSERGVQADLTVGDAASLPFATDAFDVVFTSGCMIHIPPPELLGVCREIARVSNRFIMGKEYFARSLTEIEYRGHTNVLFKGPYHSFFELSTPFELLKLEYLRYLDTSNQDILYLLSNEN